MKFWGHKRKILRIRSLFPIKRVGNFTSMKYLGLLTAFCLVDFKVSRKLLGHGLDMNHFWKRQSCDFGFPA